MLRKKVKLIDKFPDFNSFFPPFVEDESLKNNCYNFLSQCYIVNPSIAGKWNRDKGVLKEMVYKYCYSNQNK